MVDLSIAILNYQRVTPTHQLRDERSEHGMTLQGLPDLDRTAGGSSLAHRISSSTCEGSASGGNWPGMVDLKQNCLRLQYALGTFDQTHMLVLYYGQQYYVQYYSVCGLLNHTKLLLWSRMVQQTTKQRPSDPTKPPTKRPF